MESGQMKCYLAQDTEMLQCKPLLPHSICTLLVFIISLSLSHYTDTLLLFSTSICMTYLM